MLTGRFTRPGATMPGDPPAELLIITLAVMVFTLIALAGLAVNVFQVMDSAP